MELEEIKKIRAAMQTSDRELYDAGVALVNEELEKMKRAFGLWANKPVSEALLQAVLYLQGCCEQLEDVKPALKRLVESHAAVLQPFLGKLGPFPEVQLYFRYIEEARACAEDHPDWTPAQLADPVLERISKQVMPEEAELVAFLLQLLATVPRG